MKYNFNLQLIKKIKKGVIGVLPTDTIYGLVGLAFSKKAIERIYQVRQRDLQKPMIILISCLKDLDKFNIKVNSKTEGLLKKFWPGKISVILPCLSQKFRYLHRGGKTLTFRWPNNKELINLIEHTGPIAAPSANFQGKPPAKTVKEAKSYFGEEVDFYVDKGKLENPPSTILELQNGNLIARRLGEIKLPNDYLGKIFAVYKPKGPTSYDVVQSIKNQIGKEKVGHAGTLDPLAKGVLVIGIGRAATKNLNKIEKMEKEYLAKIKFGEESSTDDLEGEKTKISNQMVKLEKIEKIINNFQGEILQKPPAFSAIKVHGKRAYQLARKGKVVKIRSRRVIIKQIKIVSFHWPYLEIKVITGPGVYIRALARDLGKKLKTGAYLAELERIRVGNFTKEKSIKYF